MRLHISVFFDKNVFVFRFDCQSSDNEFLENFFSFQMNNSKIKHNKIVIIFVQQLSLFSTGSSVSTSRMSIIILNLLF